MIGDDSILAFAVACAFLFALLMAMRGPR